MAASTHAHWSLKNVCKTGLRRIEHSARGVVHGAHEHPGKRNCDVVLRVGCIAPFQVFHSLDAFRANQVGPGPGQNGRPYPAMKINQQLAIGGLSAEPVVEIDHKLIVPLHEVDFDALYAPRLKLVKRSLELIVQGLPHSPQDDSDILLLAVSDQFLDIHFGHYVEEVAQLIPAFVQYYVLDAVF